MRILILRAGAFCLAGLFLPGASSGADAGWKLSWSEEFAAPAVDAAVWGFENGYVRNNEAQFYSNRGENSRNDSGALLIRALKDDWNGHAYTSASRTTHGKKSFKYGRFEMRARIDVRTGSWPAWWWLPDSGGWPRGGEIDMMEFYQGQCLFNVMDGNGKWFSPRRTITSLGGPRWAAAFHTWTMEWDSLKIDLSLDGVLINHFPLAQADGTGPNGSNPFRHQGYMILNQAIGGNQGGDPSGTAFPVDFRVDWVRVHTWTPGNAHTLTVTGGTGSGTYLDGASVSLTAGMPPEGRMFDRWVPATGSAAGSAVIDEAMSASARLTMPAADITVQAAYRPIGTALRFFGGRTERVAAASLFRAYSIQGRRLVPAVNSRSPDWTLLRP